VMLDKLLPRLDQTVTWIDPAAGLF
jgi:hypothetical protein